MAEYMHGAYGRVNMAGVKVARESQGAIIYVGTAPVQTVAGGESNVNKPVVVYDMAEAQKHFGYSDDWAKYTLCEAMYAHFELNAVGPLILINVFDISAAGGHRDTQGGEASLAPVNGRIEIADCEDAILDTVAVAGKTRGADFTVQYNIQKKTIVISEVALGALGTEVIEVTWAKADVTGIENSEVIGTDDGAGLKTGLHVIKNVYPLTGIVPSFLLAPGFSEIPEIHNEMKKVSAKINGHWYARILSDIPIADEEGGAVTLDTAYTWKKNNGYTAANETVYFPLHKAADGRIFHISVLAAANLQTLLSEQDGIPYKTPSNTEIAMAGNLYLGENNEGRVYDDEIINEKLNKNGICSAVYTGGRWVIWGCHTADYDQENANEVNVYETNMMMLFYVCNNFQHRRAKDVDKPLSINDIKTIASEEQARLDALVKMKALTKGSAKLKADTEARSDMVMGDYSFAFDAACTPLTKSLTAIVNRVNNDFEAAIAL